LRYIQQRHKLDKRQKRQKRNAVRFYFRYADAIGGWFGKRGNFLFRFKRRCRSLGISVALFSHLADNNSAERETNLAKASQRFVSLGRVCPFAITASTCWTQRELFWSESDIAAESIIEEVWKLPWRFLILSVIWSRTFLRQKGRLSLYYSRMSLLDCCTRWTFLARREIATSWLFPRLEIITSVDICRMQRNIINGNSKVLY